MDKLEVPLLASITPHPPSLDALPDSTTPPANNDLPPLSPSPEEEEEEADVEQEVVDVESYQPCVVDLTNEDEDDVDVVAVVSQEQSVIYLGTEHRRHNTRRRNNHIVPPPTLEDLTRPDQQQNSVFESGGDHDGGGEGTREDEGVLFGSADRQQNPWLSERAAIDFQNPTLVFGNLLEDNPLEAGENHIPRRHNPLREFRPTMRRQRSRSRSPQIPDYSRDGRRTPEIVQDVHEMQSEMEHRRQPSHFSQIPIHSAVQIVTREHNQRVQQLTTLQPPHSPPPSQQPIISCLVCLDSAGTIKDTSRTLCSTVCGHVFCSTCMEEVVKRKKQCPVCRKKLTKKQYHPLFI